MPWPFSKDSADWGALEGSPRRGAAPKQHNKRRSMAQGGTRSC
jgi:hypothetical protein